MRVEYGKIEPEAVKIVSRLSAFARERGIEESLVSLIEIRASQINGCAYCLDMHTQDAMAAGEKEQRIFCLSAWRDSPFFTEREQAALELTEAVTRISDLGVPDELYQRVMKKFNEHEYVALLMAINAINCWNRLSIACGRTAGMYRRTDHTA
ncbi:alkylhydroperoxidase AhpD family core domain protein [Thermoplasmatales archaeon]|nr:alkylhydroperoxidase AhpD family core domain protein [Thermoplasmatales archaeon]